MAALARVGFFEGFGPEEIRLIAFGGEPRKLRHGERLVREGSYSDGAYVVARGALDLASRHAGSDRVVAGDIVSPLALLTEVEHAHTAVADGDTEVIKVSRQLFRRVLEEYPHLAGLLYERIAGNLAAMGVELDGILERMGDVPAEDAPADDR